MSEAYRTWTMILPYQSIVCARDATCFLIYQDVRTKASNLDGVWHVPLFISYSFLFYFFILFFYQKNFSLRLFLYCSYFSSDFSLSVLINFVLNKKKKSVYDAQFCPTASWKIRNIFARVTMSQFSNYGGCKLKVPW